ncbi:leucine-rich repeat-containing protein 18 [Hypomesus transpacificus]|uniref:leucine-rich repeat-containing protein 18 n=1 Tax=Hypomesus transpacificus TaxID=137520 RepID=UPI001F07592C|nr:leucine-rich repeat-containing protein 18 [Hypomesus transpacificus]XP_046888430.1 leucine-rich repeat-containing protein 18 [Hypomesus transpacificus]
MAKGKKSGEPKGKKITLKMAKNALRLTVDGKRRLDLSNMEIATFPKCILKLADVDELDLSRNMLRKIPDSIHEFVNIRMLDLHSNQLENLPAAIGRLQNLVSLNLCNNRLTDVGLPSEVFLLRKLHSLNLGMNFLDTVPSSIGALKELRHLGIFNNNLTRLPESLHSLPNLESLNARCNPIPSDDKPPLDPIQRVECLYLVSESCLCEPCLRRLKEERQRMDGRIDDAPAKKRSMFTGLVTPNSVAQDEQATWR